VCMRACIHCAYLLGVHEKRRDVCKEREGREERIGMRERIGR